ncbi:MAG: MmcQ/YjbR family DNA-binding protein [Kofleriaceae bacterium]
MKWDRLRELAKELPGVVDSTSYGTAAIKVGKKLLVRLKEDGKDVVFILESVDEQVGLCDANPALYYITDHYRGYATVLARLAVLTVGEARVRLERAWSIHAPASLLSRTPRVSPRSSRARSR